MKKNNNNPLTTTVLRAVLWRKLVWHGLCILRFTTTITYLIISVEYPTTKIENSICISSKMRSIQIMVHYNQNKKKMAAWDHTLPQPHSTFTPYVLLDQAIVLLLLLLPKKQNYHLKQSLFTHSHSTRNWASKPRYIIWCFEYFGYILPSEVPLLLLLKYSSMNNQCCKFKSACVKKRFKSIM